MPDVKETEKDLDTKLAPILSQAGYNLVRIKMTSGGRYITLQIMAERADSAPMTVKDCTSINHLITPILDGIAPIAGRYTLEVSSPGIDRPLVRITDYQRFSGHTARIEMNDAINGQKRFQGSIVRVTSNTPDNAMVELRTEHGSINLAANAIAKAQLIHSTTIPKTKHV